MRRTTVADRAHPGHPWDMNRPRRDSVDSLWRPDRRALTLGLVLTITLVGFEALAVSTVMPIAARELGGIELYGWVFSAFFLGSLIGIVVVGGAIDRGGLALPFAVGLGLFAIGLLAGGLAPAMLVLVIARFVQGLGAGTIQPIAYVAIGRTLPEALRPRMFATLVHGVGPARPDRPRHRRQRRRDVRLALCLPRAVAAHRHRRRADARGAACRGAGPGRDRSGVGPGAQGPPAAGHDRVVRRGALPRRPDERPGRGDGPADRGRPADRDLGAAAPDAARDAHRPAGPAGCGPAPRHPDLRVLRHRCVRGADRSWAGAACRRPRQGSP